MSAKWFRFLLIVCSRHTWQRRLLSSFSTKKSVSLCAANSFCWTNESHHLGVCLLISISFTGSFSHRNTRQTIFPSILLSFDLWRAMFPFVWGIYCTSFEPPFSCLLFDFGSFHSFFLTQMPAHLFFLFPSPVSSWRASLPIVQQTLYWKIFYHRLGLC